MGTLVHALSINPFRKEIIAVNDEGLHLIPAERRKRSKLSQACSRVIKKVSFIPEGEETPVTLPAERTFDGIEVAPTQHARRIYGPRLISQFEASYDVKKLVKCLTPEEDIIIQLLFFKDFTVDQIASWASLPDNPCTADDVRRCVIRAIKKMRVEASRVNVLKEGVEVTDSVQ